MNFMDVEKVVSLALELGADEAEVFHSSGQSFLLTSVKERIHSKQFNEESGFGVRVLKKRGIGFSFFSREQDAERAIKNALDLSDYSEKTDFHFPEKQTIAKAKCFDKKISELNEEDGKKLLLELLGGVKKKARPTECFVSFGGGEVEIVNSSGLSAAEKYSELSLSAEAEFKGKTGHESQGSSFLDLDVEKIGETAGERARDAGKASKITAGKYAVVFDVRAVYSFIFELLLPSFNGNIVRRGSSFLRGKLGKRIACEEFSLADDPFACAVNACSFDGEGIASEKKELVEQGVLKNFLFDLKTISLAKGLERELNPSPGNCARENFDDAPGIGHSNLIVGSGSVSDLVRECKKGVYITSFFGTHTANKITGDFTVSLDCGYEIEKGELCKPIMGAMLSGNVFNLLERISGIEKKQEKHFELISPRIAFEKISASA